MFSVKMKGFQLILFITFMMVLSLLHPLTGNAAIDSTVPSGQIASNLFANPDFETGTVNGWTARGNSTLTVNSDAHTGAYSMKVVRTAAFRGVQQSVYGKMKVGSEYDISLWVKVDAAGAGKEIRLTLDKSIDGGTKPSVFKGVGSAKNLVAGQWTQIQATYKVTEETSGAITNLTLYLESATDAFDIYVDDAVLLEKPNELVSNSGMELGVSPWQIRGSGVVLQAVYAPQPVYNGTKSLLVSGRSANWKGVMQPMITKLVKGKTYIVSAWVRLPEGKEEKVSLSLQKVIGGVTSYQGVASVTANGQEWKQISGAFTLEYTGTLTSLDLYFETASTGTDFYLDDVSVVEKVIPTKVVQTDIPSLKDVFAADFPIGVALPPDYLNGDVHSDLVKKHFNSITAENSMKPSYLQPTEGVFTFDTADAYVNFAQANGMKVRGHTLVWHQGVGNWMFVNAQGQPATKELLYARLENHIKTIVERYKGKIYAWDVVNEAIDASQSDGFRRTNWYSIAGPEFIEKAFQYAHEADPDAKLFYNEFGIFESTAKLDFTISMIQNLLAKGVPIHGIGVQTHNTIYIPDKDTVDRTMAKLAALGIDIQITEMDMSIYKNATEKYDAIADKQIVDSLLVQQAYQFKDMFEVFNKYKANITGVTFWGLADDRTWLDSTPGGRKDLPLLFDESLKAKSAYWALVDPSKLPVLIQTIHAEQSGDLTMDAAGLENPVWDYMTPVTVAGSTYTNASFKTLWHDNALYVKVEVVDSTLDATDAVKLFVDGNNRRTTVYDQDDHAYTYSRLQVQGSASSYLQDGANGYKGIFRLPLDSTLTAVGKNIGFDVSITNGAETIHWNDTSGQQAVTMANVGLLKFTPASLYAEARRGTPIIDGEIDASWDESSIHTTERYSTTSTAQGAKGKFRTQWDDQYLYVLVEVDDPLLSATNAQTHLQDSVELFMDENNHKSSLYENDDAQIRFNYLNQISSRGTFLRDQLQSVTKTVYGANNSVLGYRVEAAIRWNKITPVPGHVMGFDVQVNDDPGIGTRNSVAMWNNLTDSGWVDTSGFGVIRLVDGAVLAGTEVALTGDEQVKIGETYTLDYGLKAARNVSAQDVTLTYDSQVFELIGAQPLAANTVILNQTSSNPAGTERFVLATTDASHALNGDVPVLRFTFTAKKTTSGSILGVGPVLLADGSGNELHAAAVEKAVIVAAILNKTVLQAALQHAQSLFAGAVEGYANGQYMTGAKAALQAVIGVAGATFVKADVTQEELDQAVVQVNQAVALFTSKLITASTGDIAGAGGLPDGKISVADLGFVAYHFGTSSTNANWAEVSKADIDKNGVIDMYDLTFIAKRVV
ncbi:endo-1,4-beta-xylanase [Paenibacillus qinlingensis]|uniref:endo-1,4-beta-xylanase n=1 Tax=Paenibacillus qinlingensis TaxID=1837343 RepID=UPI0015651DAD|nr:endo-1,4-beta-xylanase [Paenibacillus qinlingensis]NQX59768.1 endo-1,4-beta-xylanase [Paenibacillus qinlingensis]